MKCKSVVYTVRSSARLEMLLDAEVLHALVVESIFLAQLGKERTELGATRSIQVSMARQVG